jgi:uncharacterized protein YbaR (Trm112 family)
MVAVVVTCPACRTDLVADVTVQEVVLHREYGEFYLVVTFAPVAVTHTCP